MIQKDIEHSLTISADYDGKRLDAALAELLPDYSRSRLKNWILSGEILLNNENCTPKTKLRCGDSIVIKAKISSEGDWQAEDIPLNIIFEDEDILIINKPAGLVVHPGAGNQQGTLLNGLLHHAADLIHLPRAGIVHRLDKDTTGLMVIAKTINAYHQLVNQLQARDIHRSYLAIVYGQLTGGGTIDAPIGRHPKNRLKMAVVISGKPAVTHFRIKQRFKHFTYLDVQLETGRTHQIRVHMAHRNNPIVGDTLYSRLKLPKDVSTALKTPLKAFSRQALHATKLEFEHPTQQHVLTFDCEPPDDFKKLLDALNHDDN